MTFEKPTDEQKNGKTSSATTTASSLERDNTAATIAGFDIDTPTQQPSINNNVKDPQPVLIGSHIDTRHFGANNVADNRVFTAFKASQTLQCVAILDICLAAVSALSFAPFYGLICLAFIPFGIVGRAAARSYCDGKLLMTYIVYCVIASAARLSLAIVFGVFGYSFDMVFELLKFITQLWFLFIAFKFRSSVRELTDEERHRLKDGRVAIARSEMLVYV